VSFPCPACRAEVALAERVPNGLAGTFAYVSCPHAACSRDLVAQFSKDVDAEPRLLRPIDAFEQLRSQAERQSRRELRKIVVIVAMVVGTAALGVSCIACADDRATPAIMSSLLVVAIVTIGVLLLVRVGFVLDAKLGARRWMRRLPRAQLAFVRLPSSYRS
jgi:hypothetical protein